MDEATLRELVALGESRSVEFKGPCASGDRRMLAKVARAVLAMTNLRDGGYVLLGVAKDGSMPGLSERDVASWTGDDARDRLAEYADPSVAYTAYAVASSGVHCVVLRVEQFDDIPVLCRRPYPDVLQRGACYVRSRRKPESVPVATQEDMRDLLEIATQRRLRALLATVRASGGEVAIEDVPQDTARFDEQLGGLV